MPDSSEDVKLDHFLLPILNALPVSVMLIDLDYNIVFTNQNARDTNGGRKPSGGATKCYQFSHHQDFPCNGNDHICPHRQVIAGAKRASDLVQQILTFSRKKPHEMSLLDIRIIVKEAVKLLKSTFPATIEIRACLKTDTRITGNPTNIQQVVMNLCTNAKHAMGENGGVLSVGIEKEHIIKAEDILGSDVIPGDYIKLWVGDTGTGFDMQASDKLFDPYYTTKEQGEGTGLGLSVVAGIVKTHNGFITIESEKGKGSVFNVFFPSVEHSEYEVTDMIPREMFYTGNENIMLIDDQVEIRESAGIYLTERGYTVSLFDTGDKALNAFIKSPDRFDLIVTDMTMPGMTGDILAKEILAIRPQIPIIICTGYSEKFSEEQAIESGIRHYMYKPLNLNELSRVIRDALDHQEVN